MSQKINGYTKEEAAELVQYIKEGKNEGKTLSYLFATFGDDHGRAKGSVRNYYYTLLKSGEREEVKELLKDSNLKAETIREFTEEETNRVIRDILVEKSKGLSVRRAISNLSKGDDKLMLRYQNKYRNILKKEPQRIQAIMDELGLKEDKVKRNELLQKKVENEINALYDRISKSLKEENERLRSESSFLKAQVLELQAEIACLKGGKPTHTNDRR